MDLKPSDRCLSKRKIQGKREVCMKTEAESKVKQPRAKEHLEASRSCKRQKRIVPRTSGESVALLADTLISDSGL